MPKLNPKNIKNKVKNTQKYLPNPPKMRPKSLPGTLLGALLQKVFNFPPNVHAKSRQMGAQGEPKCHQKSQKLEKRPS